MVTNLEIESASYFYFKMTSVMTLNRKLWQFFNGEMVIWIIPLVTKVVAVRLKLNRVSTNKLGC